MSLTSMIADRDSELNAFFDQHSIRERAEGFVKHHNTKLRGVTPIVSPMWGESDWGLTGTAAIYMLALERKTPAHLVNEISPTIAQYAATLPVHYGGLLCAITEQHYRKGTTLKLSDTNRLQLPRGLPAIEPDAKLKMQATVEELKILQPRTSRFCADFSSIQSWKFHKTFDKWSMFFGGADANLLLNDNTIVDIRTSRKREPMTVDNFLQQVMYAFFATESTGKKVDRIGWFYVRHGIYVEHEPDYLFGLTSGIHQMIEDAEARAEEERDEWDDYYTMDGMTHEDYFDFD